MSDVTDRRESPGYSRYVLLLLTLVNVINYVDRNIVFALFEPIKEELGLSDTQLGWLGSAYVIVFSLAAVPAGILSDLKSRRLVAAAGIAIWSAATALGGLARQYWQLFACRSVVGIGEASYSPAAQSMLADYFPARGRALALGIFSGGVALGGVAGIWLGGELEELYGWRTAFFVIGIPGLVLAVLVGRIRDPWRRRSGPYSLRRSIKRFEVTAGRFFRATWPLWAFSSVGAVAAYIVDRSVGGDSAMDIAIFATGAALGAAVTVARAVRIGMSARAVRAENGKTRGTETTLDDFVESAKVVLHTPTLIWLFVGGALIAFAMNGLVGWAPTFMQRALGLSPQVAGRTIGLWGLAAGVLGALFGGQLGDLLRERHPAGRVVASALGFLIGGPLCVWLLLVRDLDLFIPLFFTSFFFLTWYHGPLAATVFDVVPPQIGASVVGSFVFFTHIAGDAVAFPLIGFISDRLGIEAAVLVLPVVAVLGGTVLLIATWTVAGDMVRVHNRAAGDRVEPS